MKLSLFFNRNIVFPDGTKELVYHKKIINKTIYRKIAIFACFSSNGSISNLDYYYLKELNKIFDGVVLIYDNPIYPKELNKVKNMIICGIFKRHHKYDFGSYELGYKYLKENNLLKNLNTLLLTNNSVYGPIFSLKDSFNKMNGKHDFWGMIENKKYETHIQSWFICLNTAVIKSNALDLFLTGIKKYKLQFSYVLNYEIKFTKFLTDLGFKYDTYLPRNFIIKKFRTNGNMCFFPVILMRKYKIPFVKAKMFEPYFYHINDERKGIMNEIKTKNKELYNLIISKFKQKKMDLSFLN